MKFFARCSIASDKFQSTSLITQRWNPTSAICSLIISLFQSTSLITQRWNFTRREVKHLFKVSIHIVDYSTMKSVKKATPAKQATVSIHIVDYSTMKSVKGEKLIQQREFQSTSLITQRWNALPKTLKIALKKFQSTSLITQRWNLWLVKNFLYWLVSIHIVDYSTMKYLAQANSIKDSKFQSTSLITQRWNCKPVAAASELMFQSTSLITQRWNVWRKCVPETQGFNPHRWLLNDEICGNFYRLRRLFSFNPHRWLLNDEISLTKDMARGIWVSIHIVDYSTMKFKETEKRHSKS